MLYLWLSCIAILIYYFAGGWFNLIYNQQATKLFVSSILLLLLTIKYPDGPKLTFYYINFYFWTKIITNKFIGKN